MHAGSDGRLNSTFKEQLDVNAAQIIQETVGSMEERIVAHPSFDANSERRLIREIRARLGEEIQIDLRVVNEIPRETNGKSRAVKSKVGGNAQ